MKPKLLVVECWGLGDLAIATPFLRAACERFDVTLLAKPYALDLQPRFWPAVKVIPFTAPWTTFHHKYRLLRWPWKTMLRTLRQLRRERFDAGFSARWDPRDHFLLWLVGARQRIGFRRAGSSLFLTRSLDRDNPVLHQYEFWRRIAAALDLPLPPRKMLLASGARRGGDVLVHTGAGQPVRVWPLDRFQALVRQLRAGGHAVRVACDPDQRAWWLAAGERAVVTPATVSELLGVIDAAGCFIGNDSGPGHLAAFCGLPTFTLFGPQLPERFAPLNPASEWMEGWKCPYRPCSDYCRFAQPKCLLALESPTVEARAAAFVARHAGCEPALTLAVEPAAITPAAQPKTATAPPIRTLHVHNSADLYGASRSLVRFLATMDRSRFQPLVVLPEDGPLKKRIEALGVEVLIHRRLSIITRTSFLSWRMVLLGLEYPVSVFWLWRLMRRRRIAVAHTNTGVIISPALAARLAGAPHFWHIRDWFQEFAAIWPAYSAYIRKLSRNIVCVSRAIAEQFKVQDNVVVLHNGFDLAEFQVPAVELRREFRERYHLGDAFVVGCVGRIKLVRKGQEELVRAVARLRRRGLACKALIVGTPFVGNESHLAQLQQMAGELGVADQVVFTGELADPRPAYAAMDALAMTSAQPEPFGGVVMEAMCMGRPVIATNIGGSLDQVVEGVTGLFVPPADAEALADAIAKLMADAPLRRRMGEAAVARIRDTFSLPEMAAKLESLFAEAAKQPTVRR